MEDPKEAKKRGAKSVVKRDVIRLVTAGTLTEENLLDSRRNNFLLSLAKTGDMLGVSWLDLSTGDFFLEEIGLKNKPEADCRQQSAFPSEPGGNTCFRPLPAIAETV